MKAIRIFILILITSCGTKNVDKWKVSYPPEMEQQIQIFKDYAPEGFKFKRLKIELVNGLENNDGKRITGITHMGRHLIQIDQNSWFQPSTFQPLKTAILMHELGHFTLGRSHNDYKIKVDSAFYSEKEREYTPWNTLRYPVNSSGRPVSFMQTELASPSDKLLKEHPKVLDYYMNELFYGD